MKWLALLVLVACKSRGTIAIEIAQGDLTTCTMTQPIADAFLFAKPNVTCESCACSACSAVPGGVDGCDGACGAAPLSSVELDLDPGHWAVVYVVVDASGRELAQACVDIAVDADGTSSGSATATTACLDAETCP